MTAREVRVPATTLWRAPDAPRDVDEPAVRVAADPAEWADGMDLETRLGLHGRTESQLLLGEPVRVLDERDGWSHVAALWQPSSQHAEGYPGWVRSAHLAAPVPVTDGPTVHVTARVTSLDDGTPVSGGTVLWRTDADDTGAEHVEVRLPGGRTGRLPRADVRLSSKAERPAYAPEELLDRARLHLGLRYLWGGTSAWGLDCSGLVHLVLRSFGVVVPRDAHDQAARLEPVALDAVQPGDLYFFARPGRPVHHVGFVTRPVAADGTRWMLHAPERDAERIEEVAVIPRRLDELVSAGRVSPR